MISHGSHRRRRRACQPERRLPFRLQTCAWTCRPRVMLGKKVFSKERRMRENQNITMTAAQSNVGPLSIAYKRLRRAESVAQPEASPLRCWRAPLALGSPEPLLQALRQSRSCSRLQAVSESVHVISAMRSDGARKSGSVVGHDILFHSTHLPWPGDALPCWTKTWHSTVVPGTGQESGGKAYGVRDMAM